MKNKNYSPSRKLNHIALFAGMGGFIVAANRLDIRTTFINEVDHACNKTLAKSFPNVGLCQKDIREVNAQDLAENNDDVDILSAGFPCQSFSQAGANKGFADERGKLFFEITRLASLLATPPKVLVLENVPFLSVFNGGRSGTGAVLEEGMFFTIEPMINLGRPETKVLADDWTAVTRDKSLSAQFEHSIGITSTGCEIFTLSPSGKYHPTYSA